MYYVYSTVHVHKGILFIAQEKELAETRANSQHLIQEMRQKVRYQVLLYYHTSLLFVVYVHCSTSGNGVGAGQG